MDHKKCSGNNSLEVFPSAVPKVKPNNVEQTSEKNTKHGFSLQRPNHVT